jgi:hypothetical protein
MEHLKPFLEFFHSRYRDNLLKSFDEDFRINNYTDEDFDKIRDILENDCVKFLGELGEMISMESEIDFFSLVFRGIRDYDYDMPGLVIKYSRKDRRPTDMSQEISDDIDRSFVEKFGYPLRSSGVFCTKSHDFASRYVHDGLSPFLFFPVGDYKYYWSENIVDLYAEVWRENWYMYMDAELSGDDPDKALKDIVLDREIGPEEYETIKDNFDEVLEGYRDEYRNIYKSFIETVTDTYIEGDSLSNVNRSELTFICDKYYLVDSSMMSHICKWLGIDISGPMGDKKTF